MKPCEPSVFTYPQASDLLNILLTYITYTFSPVLLREK